MIRDANRRLIASHAKDIRDYLNETREWILGSFLLGIAHDAIEFEPYKDIEGDPNPTFGELRLLTNRRNSMRIFDGQHRRRAIEDLLSELIGDAGRNGELEEFRNASVPIVLYEEDDIKALRQMFADASKTKPIEPNTVALFDQRDAFNQAAIWLSEHSDMFAGRVDMDSSSVTGGNSHLVSISQLVGILRILAVGYSRRVTRGRNDEYMQDLPSLFQQCKSWADEFLPAAREEYQGLIDGGIESSEIPQWRRVSLAFNVTVIRAFAGCHQLWSEDSDQWEPLAEFIRSSDLSVGAGQGSLLVDAGVVAPGGSYPVGRRQEVQGAINYIVATVKKTQL
jgi:DGQHR domain-containing protein